MRRAYAVTPLTLALLLAACAGSDTLVDLPDGTNGGGPLLPLPLPGASPTTPPEAPGFSPADAALPPLRLDAPPDLPPLQKTIETWSLDIAPDDLTVLDSATRDTYVPATVTVHGQKIRAQARYHGRSSRDFPKKSFTINLGDTEVEGRKHFVFLAMYQDAGYLTEKLWWDLALSAGVPASRARYVELVLNGKPYGLMLDVEHIDKRFLLAHGFDVDSDVFRCGQKDCTMRDRAPEPWMEKWEKQTNEKTGDANLWDFLRKVNHTPESELVPMLEANFDTDAFARWMAVDAAISIFTTEDCRDYLVQDAKTGKWSFLPWDMNNSLAMYLRRNDINHTPIVNRDLMGFTAYDSWTYKVGAGRNLPAAWSVLHTRFVDRPETLEQFADRLEWLLANRFNNDMLDKRIDEMDALLKPYRDQDPWVDQAYAARAASYLKKYVKGRHDFLAARIGALRAHGRDALLIDRVTLRDNGEIQALELVNRRGHPLHVGGMFLTGDLRNPKKVQIPAGTTIEPGGRLVLKDPDDLGLVLDPKHPELGVYMPDGTTALDLMFLPDLMPGLPYGRSPVGSENIGPVN